MGGREEHDAAQHQIDNGSQREAHFNFLGRAAKRKIIVVFLHGKNLPIMSLKRAAREGEQPRAPSPVEFDVFRKNPIRSEIYILRVRACAKRAFCPHYKQNRRARQAIPADRQPGNREERRRTLTAQDTDDIINSKT